MNRAMAIVPAKEGESIGPCCMHKQTNQWRIWMSALNGTQQLELPRNMLFVPNQLILEALGSKNRPCEHVKMKSQNPCERVKAQLCFTSLLLFGQNSVRNGKEHRKKQICFFLISGSQPEQKTGRKRKPQECFLFLA